MELLEELTLETALTRPRLWKRYDDTFCNLRKGSTEELLHHLNGVRLTIKFTVEQEGNRTLPFLDTLLRRREDGSLPHLCRKQLTRAAVMRNRRRRMNHWW